MWKKIKERVRESVDRGYRSGLLLAVDLVMIQLYSVIGLLVRFDLRFHLVEAAFWQSLQQYWWINTLCTIIVFAAFHLYSSVWSFAGTTEFAHIVFAAGTASVLQMLGMHVILKLPIPRSYFLFYMMFLMAGTTCIRFLPRLYRSYQYRMNERRAKDPIPTLLVGGGGAGSVILREIKESTFVHRNVPCIIDDDVKKHGNYLNGVPIVGGREEIPYYVKKYGIQEIIFAIPTISDRDKKEILNICSRTGCKMSTLPGIYQLVNGEVHVSALRDVQIEDLLGREPIKVDLESIMDYVSGRVVAVTGGGGSIGSELCRQIAKYSPRQLIVIDNYENNAYALQMELRRTNPELELIVLIASVQDKKRICQIFEQYHPEIIYHAAAHKHVPLMEESPWEAIKNNVGGTYNVANAAGCAGVKRMVMISTDKAVRPTNVMGASKRICEMIIQLCDKHYSTEYVAVRFGNVLGSNGSVIPLFKRQIAAGGPVTVTDARIIRYFMTIPEAVSLVLQAGAYAKGGEIFILDMGEPVKILDLAENLIRLSGYKPYEDIKIVFTGLRPGEKLYEELLMADEKKQETKNRRIFIGHPIEMDEEQTINSIKKIIQAAKENDAHIKERIKELVPEYKIYEEK